MLTLYKAGNSICTQKVLMTLAEKSAAYETVNIDLFKNEQYNPEYLKINPKGVVPSLIDEAGNAIIESTVICEYLDEAIPDPPLTPAAPHLRGRMRLWSKMVDEGLFEATRELSFSAMFRERLRNMTEEQRQTRFRNVGDPERTARYKSCYAEGVESFYASWPSPATRRRSRRWSPISPTAGRGCSATATALPTSACRPSWRA